MDSCRRHAPLRKFRSRWPNPLGRSAAWAHRPGTRWSNCLFGQSPGCRPQDLDPIVDLPVVTDLKAADDAIEAGVVVDGKQRTGNRIAECDRTVVATPTVTYVAADIPTGPSPYRVCRGRRLERHVGGNGRIPCKRCECSTDDQKFLHDAPLGLIPIDPWWTPL